MICKHCGGGMFSCERTVKSLTQFDIDTLEWKNHAIPDSHIVEQTQYFCVSCLDEPGRKFFDGILGAHKT